ncbi:hypothetical protein HYH02_005066 [Chlamydomonas schloesseri]|uniref:Plastid lipid-associated protein/fibrillin conserved domain-containing protein n=1 Tax=Chlamydomonas schloesseri TaxID=2026947 RepID=A0A835WN55_9CHLO|nr:hypothetical protein HYH02_005066 [Chlamydomonas schloesseri]|eukprot:KAG2450565.1 hypothetical protein HYH02_005066 [Chlamydomonas schloesseri]
MQALLQRRAMGTALPARNGPSGRRVAVCKRSLARSAQVQRRAAVECKAFFNFFAPKPAAATSPFDPRAKPLVEQLIAITSGTDAGAKASAAQKEEIAALVTELSRYCIKNPLKSDLLFGEWKVLFASKATAVGGPLRAGAGPAVFAGQNAKQILEAPNKLVNEVQYKTLGFLPGYSRQYGTIEPVSGDTFILNITEGEIMAGLGGPARKTFDIQRKIQILYLDDEIRVALFLPTEGLADTEAEENGGSSNEDIVFVFQRIAETAEEEEAPAEDDGEEAPKAASPFPFGGTRKLESAATVAERQVRQQLNQRGGSSKVAVAPSRQGSTKVAVAPPARPGSSKVAVAPAAPARSASVRGRGRQQVEEEEVEDPRERRRREQEEARAAKQREAEAKAAEARAAKEREQRAAEAKAAKERAEAERQAEREKQAAIKDLLAQLAADIKERQAEAREAAKALKDIEKSAGSGLREVTAARSQVDEAEADVKAVSQQLDAAAASKKEAEGAAKVAKDAVVAAEKALRAAIAAAAPAIARK